MNQHSYETYEILRCIKGLEEIATLASYHHENVKRTGYPFHPTTNEFTIEARILAVADVFQALVQDRPYRQGLALNEVMKILDEFESVQKLDPSVIEVVKLNPERYFDIANGMEDVNLNSEIKIFSKTPNLKPYA